MVEHRYRDNAEAAQARGSTNLLKRLGQRETTQTSPTRFNSAPLRMEEEQEGRRRKEEEGRRYRRRVGGRGNTLVCEYVDQKCVCGDQMGQKLKRRRKTHFRGSSEMETGGHQGDM